VVCWVGGAFGTYGVQILCITSISSGFCTGESAVTRIPQASLFISSSVCCEFCKMSFHSATCWISSCRPTAAKLDLRSAQNSSEAHDIKCCKVLRKFVKEAKKNTTVH
jgi:hypothetical protein